MNIQNVNPYTAYGSHIRVDRKLKSTKISKNDIANKSDGKLYKNESGFLYKIGKDILTISYEGLEALKKSKVVAPEKSNDGKMTVEQLRQKVNDHRKDQLSVIANKNGIDVNKLINLIGQADVSDLNKLSDKLGIEVEKLMQFKKNSIW
jgi:hypothetical protein